MSINSLGENANRAVRRALLADRPCSVALTIGQVFKVLNLSCTHLGHAMARLAVLPPVLCEVISIGRALAAHNIH